MTANEPLRVPPRPVAFGCAMAAAAAGLAIFVIVLGLVFLDSGADSGTTILGDQEAYARGSIELIDSRNFYLVRLRDGQYLALSNLDAANRAASGRKCRVFPIASADPKLPRLLETYALRLSPAAAGTTLLFSEDCNGAVYDITGLRLDSDGGAPNLERYPITMRADGRLSVDVRDRMCSERRAAELFAETDCPRR